MKKEFIVVLFNEMIYIGFLVLLVLNLISTNKVEDRILLVIIEGVFAFTRVYCKVKNNQESKKGDKRYESKKDSKRNN